MGPIRQAPEEDFEAKLRAMLLRRAADAQPHRPPWETLSAGYEGTVIPLPRAGADGGSGGRRSPGWFRPAVAAASVLVLVLVGTIVVERAGNGDGEGEGDRGPASDETAETSDDAVDGPRIAAPGNNDFVAAMATPVFPATDVRAAQDLYLNGGSSDRALYEDPNLLAEEYLANAAIAWESSSGLQLSMEDAANDQGPTAVEELGATPIVYWAFRAGGEGNPITEGNVFLQRQVVSDNSGTVVAEPWMVVGSMTYGLRLKDVRRVDNELSFVVNRNEDTSGIRDVRVEVNGEVLGEGDVAIEDPEPYTYRVPSDQPVTIRLQHLDPEPVSVTEMTVPLEYQDAGDELDPDDGGDVVPDP